MDEIQKLYHNNDVCMKSLLATTKCGEVGDLTLEEAHDLYEQAVLWAGESNG